MKEGVEEEEKEEEVCSSFTKAMYMHLSISKLNVAHASPVLPPLPPPLYSNDSEKLAPGFGAKSTTQVCGIRSFQPF
jgi:hypothetical protein